MADCHRVLVGLLLGGYPDFIQSQERLQPFVISPFIGDRLDKVEEEYFKIFPTLTDFQEAVFYMNPDSSLNVKIKARFKNVLIDTTILYDNSLSYLRNRINQIILTDIRQKKVQELKLITYKDTIYDGTVYSYDNRQIKFVEKEFTGPNEDNNQGDYLLTLNYFDVNKITVNERDASVTFFSGMLCAIAGGAIAGALAPTPEQKDSFWGKDYLIFPWEHNIPYLLLGAVIGGVTGYLIGSLIKIPVDHDTSYPEAEDIINENTLLPGGLGKQYK